VVGETCHMFDYFCYLFEAPPVKVFAQTTWPTGGKSAAPDSICAMVEFANGSCGQLDYSAQGDTSYPKETFTLFASGLVVDVANFMEMTVHRGRKKTKESFSSKGHAEQMRAWLSFLKGEAEHPFPYECSRVSMLVTFAALRSIQLGRAVAIAEIEPASVQSGE
jgi:predicted dehydrogenase